MAPKHRGFIKSEDKQQDGKLQEKGEVTTGPTMFNPGESRENEGQQAGRQAAASAVDSGPRPALT